MSGVYDSFFRVCYYSELSQLVSKLTLAHMPCLTINSSLQASFFVYVIVGFSLLIFYFCYLLVWRWEFALLDTLSYLSEIISSYRIYPNIINLVFWDKVEDSELGFGLSHHCVSGSRSCTGSLSFRNVDTQDP